MSEPVDIASICFHNWLMGAMQGYSVGSLAKELLQNSDDACAAAVVVVLDFQQNTLRWFQDAALTEANFAALGRFHMASKRYDPTSIGKYGVGFASVFHVTNNPHVASNGQTWSMDLKTMALTRPLDDGGLLLKQLAMDAGIPLAEAKAVFSLPFRKETLHTDDGASFDPNTLADVERELMSTFRSPALLLFLNNLKMLRVVRRGADGGLSTRFECSVNSDELRAVKRKAIEALSTRTPMPCMTVSNATVHRGGDGTPLSRSAWRYVARVVNGTSMLQLASSIAFHDKQPEPCVLSVGLPFSPCPLVCHASASLQLDDGRVTVLDTKSNEVLLDALASMYCNDFLRQVDPYQSHWPLRSYLPEGKLQYLVKCVLLLLAEWDTGFPLVDCAPASVPSGAAPPGSAAAAVVQAPLSALCCCPDGAPANVVGSYQQLMLRGNAPQGHPYLVTSLGKDAIAAFRNVLPTTLPDWNAALCVKNLHEVLKDHASRWDVISNDQRRDLLRYILDNTEVGERRTALLGLPLCERRVSSEVSRWVQFREAGPVFLNDTSAVALLLDVTDDNAIMMSYATTCIFHLFPTASLATHLNLGHLVARDANLLRRQLQQLDAVHATQQQRRAFAVSFWALIAKSQDRRRLTAEEEAPLLSLPLLWRWDSCLGAAEAMEIALPPFGPALRGRPSGVFCSELRNCVLITADGMGPVYLHTFLPLLEALGVPLLDPDIAAGVNRLSGANEATASLLRLLELLSAKLRAAPPSAICDSILACLTSTELLEQLQVDSDHGQQLRLAVQRLPVFTILGSNARSSLLDASTGMLSGLVVESEVFQALPTSMRTSTIMFSIPRQLSNALRLVPTSAELVAAEQITQSAWLLHTPVNRVAIVSWMEERQFRTLLANVLIPTQKTQQDGVKWAPVSTVLRLASRHQSNAPMQSFVRILKTYVPDAFYATSTTTKNEDSKLVEHDLKLVEHDLKLVEHPALSTYYQRELTIELLKRASAAVPRPEKFTISVPFTSQSRDVWSHIHQQSLMSLTSKTKQYLRAAEFFREATAACHPQLIQEMHAHGDMWVPCVMRLEIPLELRAPTSICVSLSFQCTKANIGHFSFFSIMEGDAAWLHLDPMLAPGQQATATAANSWSMTKQEALRALTCRWRSVSYYPSETSRYTCQDIQLAIEEMLPGASHLSSHSLNWAPLHLCSGQLSDAMVREALEPIMRHGRPFLFPKKQSIFSSRLFLPQECTSPSMLEPFVCDMHEPWARLLGITSVYSLPSSVDTLMSRVAHWRGAVLQLRFVPVLKDYMHQVLQPLIRQALVDPNAQDLGNLGAMMLPSAGLTMCPSSELCFVYRSTGVADDILCNDRVLHHELSPEIFDCSYIGLLGVRNVRNIVAQRIDSVVCTDAAAAPLVARLTHIMKLPFFAELLQVAAYGTAPMGGAVPSHRFERLLQGVTVTLCTSLNVYWKHEIVRTEDHSVMLTPEYALETTADGNTMMSFHVLVKRFNGSVDDELIRRGVVSSLCEALSLPAATRRDDVSMALRCDTETQLSAFLDSRRPTRVTVEEVPVQPEDPPALPEVPPPRRMEEVTSTDPTMVVNERNSSEPVASTEAASDGSNTRQIFRSFGISPARPNPDDPSLHAQGGDVFRSPNREASSPYQSRDTQLPTDITRRGTLDACPPRATDGEDGAQCLHAPVDLKRSPHAATNGCPLYTDRLWERLTGAEQETVRGHLENLSRVLFSAAGHIDPAAALHTIVYYAPTDTNTLAFNANGLLAFNIGYYARQPDPYHWTVVFLHEYSHNGCYGHGIEFRKALQFHCAQYIAAVSRVHVGDVATRGSADPPPLTCNSTTAHAIELAAPREGSGVRPRSATSHAVVAPPPAHAPRTSGVSMSSDAMVASLVVVFPHTPLGVICRAVAQAGTIRGAANLILGN